jgi:hypothetical protein
LVSYHKKEHRLRERFQVLTAASMKMAVFWVVAPCISLMMEAASTSETSVNFYQTTWRNNPEDSQLRRLRALENRMLRKIFGPARKEVYKRLDKIAY